MNALPTQAELRELFDYYPHTGLVTRKKCTANRHVLGEVVGTRGQRGYLQATVASKKYPLHRLIWCWVYGSWPTDDIDHIDRDRSNNQLRNLRAVTRSENCHNLGKSRRNTSGHTGVSWDKSKGKWIASIRANSRQKFLGRFDTAEQARAAYLQAKAIYHPTAPCHE